MNQSEGRQDQPAEQKKTSASDRDEARKQLLAMILRNESQRRKEKSAN